MLVDRLWPWDVSKRDTQLDRWWKSVAPSDELQEYLEKRLTETTDREGSRSARVNHSSPPGSAYQGEDVRTKALHDTPGRDYVLSSLFITSHLAFGLGIFCAVVGFMVLGLEGGFLWALVGYFLGKAVQSTIWMFSGGRTT